jgi:suppressor of ftsI
LITAEPAGASEVRRGRFVLRGMSASTRLGPHGLQMMPAMTARPDAHAGHSITGPGWVMPPEDPNMPPMPMAGLHELVPQATPFLPGSGVDTASIPLASPRRVVDLRDGDTLKLTAGLVRRVIRGRTLIMYGFNQQYPGPLLRAPQNATVTIDFVNNSEFDSAVHWHGIRLDNASDGVPHVTQEPVRRGETFRYRVHFPDAGIYWYHPHHREDVQQDLGLYGNILVRPATPGYFAPASREEFLMLDDLLLNEDGSMFPFGKERATHAVMGRFGNLLLVNGEPSYTMDAGRGEVVRFYVTNVSNTRTFNISFDGAPMKLVASDAGRFEREEWVQSMVISPAERYVVDVRFAQPGNAVLMNRVQAIDHVYGNFYTYVDTLVTIRVAPRAAARNDSASFYKLRENADVAAELERYRRYFDAPIAHSLSLALEPKGLPFPLLQLMKMDSMYFHPVEWAGTMPMMDWLPTTGEARWVLRDTETGAENEGIHWKFRKGDVARIRLTNERRSLHAMQHPIHLHGQRFLVLTKNGVLNDNMVWKDTALIPVGETIDLLVDMSNPGAWMLHCHIAEHLEAGMQMIFEVE